MEEFYYMTWFYKLLQHMWSAVENHTITSCFTLSMQSIGNCHKYLVYFLPMAWASNSSFSQYLISVVKCSCTRTVKFYLKQGNNTACLQIDIREYWRGNQERTIQRNWQHRVHRTKKKQNTSTTQYVMINMLCNFYFCSTLQGQTLAIWLQLPTASLPKIKILVTSVKILGA
jgi:hypothetical protein